MARGIPEKSTEARNGGVKWTKHEVAILCTKRDAGISNSQIGIELGKTNQACRSAMHKHNKRKPHCDCRTVVRSMTTVDPKFTPINAYTPQQAGYVGGSTMHTGSSPMLSQDVERSHPHSTPQRLTPDSRNASTYLPNSSNVSPNRCCTSIASILNPEAPPKASEESSPDSNRIRFIDGIWRLPPIA